MASRIEQIIEEIQDYIDDCKYSTFSSTKILVNKEEIDELLHELKSHTPEEIKRYQKIISNKEAIMDDAKQKVINMVQAYKRTRAKLATAAITSAVGATQNITFNGATIDVTTGDGLALFNEAHVLKGSGNTQCNYFSDVLGSNTVVLNKAANRMRNFRDDRGEVLGFTADTLIIPGNDPEYEDFVKRVIGSDGEVGSDHNDINTQRGKWKLVVDPLWTPEISATNHPIIIYSSEALKALQGTKFYDRTALDVENDVDVHSRNLTYNGFARMSITFPNWRHAMMIGASAATTSVNDGDIFSG